MINLKFSPISIGLVEDDFFTRFVLKSLIVNNKSYRQVNLFTSALVHEGHHFLNADFPEIVIIDDTFSTKLYHYEQNYKEYHAQFIKRKGIVMVIHEKNFLPTYPDNFTLLDKSAGNFLRNLIFCVEDALMTMDHLKGNSRKTVNYILRDRFFFRNKQNLRRYFGQKLINVDYKLKILSIKKQNGNLFTRLVTNIFIIYNFVKAIFLLGIFASVAGIGHDMNPVQKGKDDTLFRKFFRYFILSLTIITVFFSIQFLLLGSSGVAVGHIHMNSIFDLGQKSQAINFANVAYDPNQISMTDEEISLKEQNIVKSDKLYSDQDPYFITDTSINFDRIEFIREESRVNNFLTSVQPKTNYQENLPKNAITYQLSTDKKNWYYLNQNQEWTVTDDNNISYSNPIQQVNKYISDFSKKISGNTLYLKVFLHSDGYINTKISNIEVTVSLFLISNK